MVMHLRFCLGKESSPKGRGFNLVRLRRTSYTLSVVSEGMRVAAMPHLPDETTTSLRCSPSRGVHTLASFAATTASAYPAARTASTEGVDAAWRGASSRSGSMAESLRIEDPATAGTDRALIRRPKSLYGRPQFARKIKKPLSDRH